MIDVRRRRMISAPGSAVRAALTDLANLQRLLPRAERVEIQGSTDTRARVVLDFRAGRFGSRRVEGEARISPDGLRFVAVWPAQIDARWVIQEHGDTCEVTAGLAIEPGGLAGSFGRFLPRRLIEQRIGGELEASLDALEALVVR